MNEKKTNMKTNVEFWGVRGSIPVNSPAYTYFGGHTSCVSVTHKDKIFIFDAGSGLRDLGEKLDKANIKQATLILSHMHFDHILGLPFFAPIWKPDFELILVSAYSHKNGGLPEFLDHYIFNEPLFPVKLNQIPAQLRYIDCNLLESLELAPDCRLEIAPLNHPGDGFGYRLECSGTTISYISDTEHIPGKDDLNVLKLMQNTDLAIYDSMYTEDEFVKKRVGDTRRGKKGLGLDK